jgi:hypothetical protein
MSHVDADVMLIDEILSVGDKSFRDKCGDVIASMRERGRTVILVSHEMGSINRHCDRAMLLYNQRVQQLGEPEDVATSYLTVNTMKRWTTESRGVGDADAAEVTAFRFAGGIEDAEPVLPNRTAIEVEAEIELREQLRSPEVRFSILDAGGRPLFVAPPRPLEPGLDRVSGSFRISAKIENRLASGRYAVMCRVAEEADEEGEGIHSIGRWLTFAIESPDEAGSVVSLESEIEVEPDDAEVGSAEMEVR